MLNTSDVSDFWGIDVEAEDIAQELCEYAISWLREKDWRQVENYITVSKGVCMPESQGGYDLIVAKAQLYLKEKSKTGNIHYYLKLISGGQGFYVKIRKR